MKRILPWFITIFLFLVTLSPVSAYNQGRGQEIRQQVATRVAETRAEISQNLQDLKNRLQQLAEQRKQERIERQATKRAEIATKVAELKTRVVERIRDVFSTILDRMMAALQRLDKIVDRINSRIAKLKDRGVDTTNAEVALTGCSDEKTAAENAINDSKAKIAAINPTSATVRTAVLQSNSAVKEGKRALQNYHKCLVGVIKTLKVVAPEEATESAR